MINICILCMRPKVNPIASDTGDNPSATVGVVAFSAGSWWLVSAEDWFKGPQVQCAAGELAQIEMHLERV